MQAVIEGNGWEHRGHPPPSTCRWLHAPWVWPLIGSSCTFNCKRKKRENRQLENTYQPEFSIFPWRLNNRPNVMYIRWGSRLYCITLRLFSTIQHWLLESPPCTLLLACFCTLLQLYTFHSSSLIYSRAFQHPVSITTRRTWPCSLNFLISSSVHSVLTVCLSYPSRHRTLSHLDQSSTLPSFLAPPPEETTATFLAILLIPALISLVYSTVDSTTLNKPWYSFWLNSFPTSIVVTFGSLTAFQNSVWRLFFRSGIL